MILPRFSVHGPWPIVAVALLPPAHHGADPLAPHHRTAPAAPPSRLRVVVGPTTLSAPALLRLPLTILLLQPHPVLDGPQVVAKVQLAGGLDTAQHALPVGWVGAGYVGGGDEQVREGEVGGMPPPPEVQLAGGLDTRFLWGGAWMWVWMRGLAGVMREIRESEGHGWGLSMKD